MTLKKSFLALKVRLAHKLKEKIVLEENRDGINLRLTASRAHGQSFFLLLLSVHEAKNASS